MPHERGVRGPHRDGLGEAPGRGAQVPAAVQAVDSLIPVAGPHVDLERFPQVRRGVLEAACLQVQVTIMCQQGYLVPQVARVPGPGQRRRADALGGGQVPGLDQHDGQDVAASTGLPSRGCRP